MQAWHPNTGMSDEKGYRSHIVDYQTAMEKLGGVNTVDGVVVHKAYELWQFSVKHGKEMERQAKARLSSGSQTSSGAAVTQSQASHGGGGDAVEKGRGRDKDGDARKDVG